MKQNYTYDVAISFAEEDRNIALALALALELHGIKKVYYYPENYEVTWGHELKARLTAIYKDEARYAIVLLSKNYFLKPFAQIELASICTRMKEKPEFIYMLPVLTDDLKPNEAEKLLSRAYFEWKYNPKEITVLLAKMLGANYKDIATTIIVNIDGAYIRQAKTHIGDNLNGREDTRKSKITNIRNITIDNPDGEVHFGDIL